MTMSSALNAGVSGLNANSMRLATISDNIANSQTYGYKRVETEFDAMVLNYDSGSGLYSAGGVRSTSTRDVERSGSLITTSNSLDIAIAGRGMLPVSSTVDIGGVSGDMPLYMIRTGGFNTDAEGFLRTESGLVLLGWPARSDGTIPVNPRDSFGALQPVQINMNQTSGDPTQNIALGVNLPATATEFGASGDTLQMKIEYYGNLGTTESLSFDFTPTPSLTPGLSNTWRMTIQDSATAAADNPIGVYDVEFDDTAALGGTIKSVTKVSGSGNYATATGKIDLMVGGLASSETIMLEIGKIGGQTGLKQLANSFAPTNIVKDGSLVGNLSNVEIDEQGMIRATYDTGFVKTLYQIPLIDVPNPNGLMSVGAQTYKVSTESGSFFLWDAGDGPTGSVVGYAREESTTDIATELTNMIVTQRAYSSNAKVIQTVDEMMQETTNIKR